MLQNQVASAPPKGKVVHIYEWSALLIPPQLFVLTARTFSFFVHASPWSQCSEQSYARHHLCDCLWLRVQFPHESAQRAHTSIRGSYKSPIRYDRIFSATSDLPQLTHVARARPKPSRLFYPYVYPRYAYLFRIGMELPPPTLVTVSANFMCASLVRSCRPHPGR